MMTKIRFAMFAGLMLATVLPLPGHAQGYIQVPVPTVPGFNLPEPEDREWRRRFEHCRHLGEKEHELRERLATAPPYGDERGRIRQRLSEVHYEQERCAHQ